MVLNRSSNPWRPHCQFHLIGFVDFVANLPSNVCFWYTGKNGTLSAARPNGWVSAEIHIQSLLFPIVHVALTGLFRFFLLEESAHYVNR